MAFKPRILLTGGSGLLGEELRKLDADIIAPGRSELDVTQIKQCDDVLRRYEPSIVIHAAANPKPPLYDDNPALGIQNILGTANMAWACHEVGGKFVFISTDYVYSGAGPHKEDELVTAPSKYVWSKLGGECAARLTDDVPYRFWDEGAQEMVTFDITRSLILRLSFGPRPFPWEKVYKDQWCSKLYVDEIAPLVLKAAKSNATGVMNIGGPRITLEEYARKSKPDIETIERPAWVPQDTSLDLTKMNTFLT